VGTKVQSFCLLLFKKSTFVCFPVCHNRLQNTTTSHAPLCTQHTRTQARRHTHMRIINSYFPLLRFVSFRSPAFFYLLVHSKCTGFLFSLDHTQTHTTVGRTPLDEGSARCRDLYLTTQTLTTDKHPCPRWDSNPRSQQALGRRPTP
jgi:hypothetical protein